MNVKRSRLNQLAIVFVTATIIMMVITPTIMAIRTDSDEQVVVDASGYDGVSSKAIYDASPRVYGKYIVWQRAIDLDSDNTIGNNEPSWIMLHDIYDQTELNITPAYLERSVGVYYHAYNPDIHEKTVSYGIIDQYGTRRMNTYYINNETTMEDYPLGVAVANDVNAIHEDWVLWTKYGSLKDMYLFNVDTGVNLQLGVSSTQIAQGDVHDYYAVYGEQTGSEYQGIVFNLTEQRKLRLDFNDGGYDDIIAKATFDDFVAIEGYRSGGFIDLLLLDLHNYTWQDIGINTTKTYSDMTQYITICNNTGQATEPRLSANYITFEYNLPDYNIGLFDIDSGTNITLSNNPFTQKSPDIYTDRVVWMDNRNSVTDTGSSGSTVDDFDIYRTITGTEYIEQEVLDIAPFILIILVIGAILGALKLFSMSGGSGGML